jgi:hypothetical protein
VADPVDCAATAVLSLTRGFAALSVLIEAGMAELRVANSLRAVADRRSYVSSDSPYSSSMATALAVSRGEGYAIGTALSLRVGRAARAQRKTRSQLKAHLDLDDARLRLDAERKKLAFCHTVAHLIAALKGSPEHAAVLAGFPLKSRAPGPSQLPVTGIAQVTAGTHWYQPVVSAVAELERKEQAALRHVGAAETTE